MRLTTLPPSRAKCQEIWEPKAPGTLWTTLGLLRDCFNFTSIFMDVSLNGTYNFRVRCRRRRSLTYPMTVILLFVKFCCKYAEDLF